MDTLIDKYNELQGNYALKSQGWFQNKSINKNINIAWIVLILNGLDSNMDFVDVKSILIPTDSALSDLYNSYINFKTAATQIA